MAGFGKVFASLYEGSMIGAGVHVFALWPYCLARANAKGYVEVNPKLACHILGCSVQDVESALEFLQRPDPESRSQEADGRRIVREGQFGYRIVNYAKYRAERDAEERREYQREWVKEKRHGRHGSTGVDSRQSRPQATQAEAEAEAEAEEEEYERGCAPPATPPSKKNSAPRNARPTLEEIKVYIAEIGAGFSAERFLAHHEATGWTWGKARHPVKDWRAVARTWKARDQEEPARAPEAPRRNGTALVGAHPAPGIKPREIGPQSPAWVQEVARAVFDTVRRPPVDEGLSEALIAWEGGRDVEEPAGWKASLAGAYEEAKRMEAGQAARELFRRRA